MKPVPFLAFCLLGAVVVCMPAGAVATGDQAPALVLPDATGRPVALDALRGKVVWVDFWASWCGPCKRSFPWMNDLLRKYGAMGLSIVAVNVDKKRQDAEKFLALAPAQFTVVYDPAGRTAAAWQIEGMPSSYLVDANGQIVFIETGFRDERKGEVESRIRMALGLR